MENLTLAELREQAKQLGIPSVTKYKKGELLELIAEKKKEGEKELQPAASEKEGNPQRQRTDTVEVTGILQVCDDGFGFLRGENYLSSPDDVYVAPIQIRRFRLKTGDMITGIARLQREGERFRALLYVNTVNGDRPDAASF